MRRQRLRQVNVLASKRGNLTLTAMAPTNVSVYSVIYDLSILRRIYITQNR